MNVTSVFAAIAVADFDAALRWYEKVFGRPADVFPMEGLAEWYLVNQSGVQVFQDENLAGKSSATFVVSSLEDQLAALKALGISFGPIVGVPNIVKATTVTDLEGNQITIAEDLTQN